MTDLHDKEKGKRCTICGSFIHKTYWHEWSDKLKQSQKENTTHPETSMRKRFYKEFVEDDNLMHDKYAADDIIEFIRKEIQLAVTKAEKRMIEEFKGIVMECKIWKDYKVVGWDKKYWDSSIKKLLKKHYND